MSQVLGTPRDPAHTITRTDRLGRPISLEYRLPERTRSVLFTGPPGLGKSLELDRAQELAKQPGWIGVRLDASEGEPLEYRFVRALNADLGTLRKRHGRGPVRKLNKTLRKLTNNIRNVTHGAELRYGVAPVQFIVKRQWDATPQDNLGATLNELADHLGDIAARKGGRVLLMVDNIDVASDRDLWALTELSAHLEKQGRDVYLVGAGGEQATARLMAASGGRSHLPTTEVNRFDIREVGFLTDDELRPALSERFRRAGIAYQPEAADGLVRSANGNPSRLRDLADTAVLLARQSGGPITTGIGEAAAAHVDRRSAVLYQAQWNKCSDEARDLLDKAAAQGSRGLSMPAETRTAGPEHWVGVDNARQELVARGLLRDDGQRVVVANPGFQDWVRRRIGRATGVAEAAPELVRPTGPQLVGQQSSELSVFGTPRDPAYRVLRTDQFGRQVSLDQRPPEGHAVLFTGQPGSGTSRELDNTQALADRYGWTALRINASPSEPLENRFVRAATADMSKYRKRHGRIAAAQLKRKLGQVVERTRNAQDGFEIRLGVQPFQFVAKRQWDEAPKDNVGKNLNELADHLGTVALKQGKPIVLMVDNLDVASDRDLAALTALAKHVQQKRLPVFLVGAGGPMTTTRLLDASGGRSGAETTVVDRFDIREVRPMTDDELRPTLTEPLRASGIACQPEAVDNLVRSANGSPSRMRDLAETAVRLAGPGGITTDVAKVATAQLNDQSRPLYQAQWNNCSAAEKDLFARVGTRGPQGLTMRAETQAAAPGRWQEMDRARQILVARGMLRENGDRVTVADPGMHEWVQTRLGQSVAHLGVALPTAPTQALTQSAATEPTRPTTTREYKGMTFHVKS
ncbi:MULTISPECIES: ATP-binding protein [unclassified Kribbella]|uniref:ATP-binding protein n=1 Tax=unclassified Kribbella TaxID=2644121 RepID=UPI0030171A2D